jgi:hypothetical protein
MKAEGRNDLAPHAQDTSAFFILPSAFLQMVIMM